MSYHTSKKTEWTDRIVVVTTVACLLVGMSVAQADDGRIVREPPQTAVPPAVQPTPRAMMTVLDQRGNEVMVFDSDGTLRFDYGGTISWSRYFVGEGWNIPNGREVLVLTWVNGPGGRSPLFLRGIVPATPKDAP